MEVRETQLWRKYESDRPEKHGGADDYELTGPASNVSKPYIVNATTGCSSE